MLYTSCYCYFIMPSYAKVCYCSINDNYCKVTNKIKYVVLYYEHYTASPCNRYVDFDVYEPCYEYAIFSYFNTASGNFFDCVDPDRALGVIFVFVSQSWLQSATVKVRIRVNGLRNFCIQVKKCRSCKMIMLSSKDLFVFLISQ